MTHGEESVTSPKPLFVNRSETLTYWELERVCAQRSAAVYPKVRVADTLRLDSAKLPDRTMKYGLMAHFDFVVTDAVTGRPLFAVEFDGPSHQSDEVRTRDALKDSICHESGFPLLRINDLHLRLVRQNSILYWMTDLWFENQVWEAKGWNVVDPHNDLLPLEWLYSSLEDATGDYPYDLSRAADALISVGARQGALLSKAAFVIHPTAENVRDTEYVTTYAVLALAKGGYVIGDSRVRKYDFPPTSAFDLSRSLAQLDAAEKINTFMRGGLVPCSFEQVDALIKTHRGWTMDGGALPVPGGVLILHGEFRPTTAWGT